MLLPFLKWQYCGAVVFGLLGADLSASAQQVVVADSTRWYLGAQAGNQAQVYIMDQLGTGLFSNSVFVYGGYAPSPRLAVQVGLRCGRGPTPTEKLEGSGSFTHYPETEQIIRAWTVPVQMRFSLTKAPHRFQVEGVLGGSVCFFTYRRVPYRLEAAPREVRDTKAVNGFLDFGIGSRLRLINRLEMVADLLLNANLRRPSNSYVAVAPGYGVALGLNYRL